MEDLIHWQVIVLNRDGGLERSLMGTNQFLAEILDGQEFVLMDARMMENFEHRDLGSIRQMEVTVRLP